MINEEAIKILKTLIPKTCKMVDGRLKGGFDDTDSSKYKAIQIAINALEKQIPKKLIKKNPICYSRSKDGEELYAYDYHCPLCDTMLNIAEHHCPCGQALDWSDEE